MRLVFDLIPKPNLTDQVRTGRAQTFANYRPHAGVQCITSAAVGLERAAPVPLDAGYMLL